MGARSQPRKAETDQPLGGRQPNVVPGTAVRERGLAWLSDGKSLLTARVEAPNVVEQVELSTGKRKIFRTIPVPDGARAEDLSTPIFCADFRSYVYAYTRIGSDLYVVEGLSKGAFRGL